MTRSELAKLVESSEKFTIEPIDCDSSNNGDCASNQQRLVMVEKEIMKPGDVELINGQCICLKMKYAETNVAYAFLMEAGCDPIAINEFEGVIFLL